LTSFSGYLEVMDRGFGFLRDITANFQSHAEDPFVPAGLIREKGLKEGDFVAGSAVKNKGTNRHKNAKLTAIDTVNGVPAANYVRPQALQDQVSIDPNERLSVTLGPEDIMGRTLDLLVPIGLGQRGLVVSPPKSGKTTILKHYAAAIAANHPRTPVFVLLVDERPEEVTDFRRSLPEACVLSSSSDQSLSQHLRMTRMAINVAVRTAEEGRDVVMLIDSLTRMSRAFNTETNSRGRTLTGGLGANAMEMPRRIFGAARNVEHGGSLTIIATILVDTGSRMDDIIFQEFKGTGNMDLVLSRKCAEQRLWPAINIHQSGTRKEHLLFDDAEYRQSVDIRRRLSPHDETAALAELLHLLETGSL
jgi:transcription termination factor Rho